MGKIRNIYLNTAKAIDDKLNKLLEGKDKEKILFINSMVVNSLIIILLLLNLIFLSNAWNRNPLGKSLFNLYLTTFIGLFCLRNLIKDIKKHLKERVIKPKKSSRKKLSEIVEEEMKAELNEEN